MHGNKLTGLSRRTPWRPRRRCSADEFRIAERYLNAASPAHRESPEILNHNGEMRRTSQRNGGCQADLYRAD
jgi:hypothetical protein